MLDLSDATNAYEPTKLSKMPNASQPPQEEKTLVPKLKERIDYLQGYFRRERDHYSKTGGDAFVNRGYVTALDTTIPLFDEVKTKSDVQQVLRFLSEQIELAGRDCDYEIESPDDSEVYNRAVHTQYRRVFYQVENLNHNLPKED